MASRPLGSQPSATQTIYAASHFFGPDGRVVCNCGQPAVRLVSTTTSNPGRVFWKCNARDQCKFFKWDDQLPPRPGSETPTPSQSSASLPPSTPSIPRTSPDATATPTPSQSTARLSSTPSSRKRSAPPEPSTQADRAKRKGSILAAVRDFNSSQTMPPTPSTSSPSKFKPSTATISSAEIPIQPPPLPAPDFGIPTSSRASDAGSSYTVHGDLSADDFFGASSTPARPAGGHADIMTPPDTGRTQRIPLLEVDNSPLKGKGKAVVPAAESDDEWNMLDNLEDTMDLDNSQSIMGSSQAAAPSLSVPVPSTIDFEHLFDDLARLPACIRSLQAENARLKEELARERTTRINAQRALKDALDFKA